ncbi:MAG: ABC transporter permease [Clostridiales bacterium]|nr:ABC transporter permease [Clostridiales bacterium]
MRTLIKIIKQHITWRRQLIKLAKSDLIKTYSGSALGWAWAIIKPAVTIFVLWFAFDIGLRIGGTVSTGHPFILWLIAGLIPWFYMDEMLLQGANALRRYNYLVTKMRFPIATIPTFVGISKLYVHIFLMVIVILFFLGYGYKPDIYLLQLPLYMLCMYFFFLAWAQFASILTCMSKDFYNLIGAATQALFWLSGILYDVKSMVVPEVVRILLLLNPITFISSGYRNVLIYKVWIWDEKEELMYFGIILFVMASLALWAYRKLYKEIPDVL